MKPYVPCPIDTSSIRLPHVLLSLTEPLAKNAHENWAAERLAQGWVWGPVRDDGTKRHPGLVPYDDLSESEKDYDRKTAMETLKAIVAMGYKIQIVPQADSTPGEP